jgi:hypothetical protein
MAEGEHSLAIGRKMLRSGLAKAALWPDSVNRGRRDPVSNCACCLGDTGSLGSSSVNLTSTPPRCKGILYSVEIGWSARRHGIADEDIIHAWEHAVRLVEYDYNGEERLLVIGPSTLGRHARTRGRASRGSHSDHSR